ncbi:hypothetical protein AB8O64_10370 [Streptomyces sp. QH1-20]|uniref:hypothetical protein n=1 Tax=Streptomyces sp. QH1-20 TaxID=3240934 RepID=UPI0035146172
MRPTTRVSLSLREGTAGLRGQILDGYLADYEHRRGAVSAQEQERARQIFDEVLAEEGEWPAES